jgi:hypothetical protein
MPKVAPKGTEHQPSCAPPLPTAPVTHYAAPRPASAAAAPSVPLLDRGNARRRLTAAATQPHQHSETRAARAPPPGTLPLHYKRPQGRETVHLTCRHGLHQLCTPAPPPVTLALPKPLKPLCAERVRNIESTPAAAGLSQPLSQYAVPSRGGAPRGAGVRARASRARECLCLGARAHHHRVCSKG